MLGVHVTKDSKVLENRKEASTMEDAIIRDIDTLGLNSAQIFTHGPRFIVKNKVNYEAVKKVVSNINLSVHSPYPMVAALKMASEKSDYIAKFTEQAVACKNCGAWGIVIHISKIASEIIAASMKLLMPIAKKYGIKIIIEMIATRPSINTYESPEKINKVTKLIGKGPWGWCIDTAHIWAAGINVKSYENMSAWLKKIEEPGKIVMFHLNGSSADMGNGKDKHEIAFGPDDKIWKNIEPNVSGVKAITEFSLKYRVVIICEINRGSEKNVVESLNIIKDMLM